MRLESGAPSDHLCRRRGATLVETAVVILVFLILVFGMLDLGIGVFQYHAVSEAARHGARQTIVHGSEAAPQMPAWGPATIDSPASDSSIPIVAALQPFMQASHLNLSTTRVRVEWPDGGNDPDQRARVTVTTSYQPFMTFIFGNPTFDLTATSTMPIAN